MEKVPAKHRMKVFVLTMTVLMGLSLSCIFLIIREGFVENFFVVWMRNFITTWLVVLPVVFTILPIANKITDSLVKKD